MRITKAIIERAKNVEAAQAASYRTGTAPGTVLDLDTNEPREIGIYTELADFPYNQYGQTPRRLCSFTASLAHLISVDPSLITSISEEAGWYITEASCNEYLGYLKLAAEHNNLQPPEGLEDAA